MFGSEPPSARPWPPRRRQKAHRLIKLGKPRVRLKQMLVLDFPEIYTNDQSVDFSVSPKNFIEICTIVGMTRSVTVKLTGT